MSEEIEIFDRALLQRRMARVAATADEHDFLLERVAEDFAERLQVMKRTFPSAVNIGAHHGLLSRRLCGLAGIETIVDCGNVPGLLQQCDGLRVLGDEEALPFANEAFDFAFSGLSFHFVNDLPGTLAQICRLLKPDGLLMASLLGGQTLMELREAWLAAEGEIDGGVSPRVAPFADLRDLGGLLQRAGFALPVVDTDVVQVTYGSALNLMREIKAMGASNPLVMRRRVPVARELLVRACAIYEERFADSDGRVPATFEIMTLTAWAPHDSQQKPLRPGSAKMRLADALGTREMPAGDKAGK